MSNTWNQTRRMKRLAVGPITTAEYIEWWATRKHSQVVPSESEIIRQDFKRKNSGLENKIEQMKEEKMNLRLDMDVQKLEIEKLRKGKNKAERDLDSLKTDYNRLRCLMKASGLGKTSEQWCQEIQEEKTNSDRWERKFHEAQMRNKTLEKTSLDKIEQMKRRVEELEVALQSCEIRIEFFEAKVADYLQTLAVQADILSVKYELKSDRGQELASLLRKIKVLSVRVGPYM
ncbi:hypothetical protein Gotri_006065 [Gossypium trilobum]|uniref:Uncharacterized protein n=1 Tax=Gossypium trilobum TaxID=34281 RepID=A0A7J9EZN7_9ROSI|nr:hypothetical protein [Gossypium trilobum]